ncbi:NAD(P)-dependent alcohol dehydrogenase [Sinimarinibacterium thermocellulolyticum]|uniref:NAD(P)-dependent alcohol dehydrogenase n=1 Tax=Sinimarinibacterium thermocellulolyticum TaxID=3170016 RepID=A0ABV2A7P5_9GAMM
MSITRAYAAQSATTPLAPWTLKRRTPRAQDVDIDILYCGVCHSDLHAARSDWAGTVYPIVPGHEIVGRVTAVGSAVTRFAPGQLVGVGCLVDSCRQCASCVDGLEQYCERGSTGTYNAPDKHSGGVTYGGYSTRIVVDEAFVLRMPESLDPAAAAPLLCAGITTYSPLRHWKVQPGMSVGVVGLGGLGHMAVKLAKAMGARVGLFTTSPAKAEDARRLGADDVILSSDRAQMKAQSRRFDLVLDTIAASHDLDAYLRTLKRDGTLVLIGVPDKPHAAPNVGNLVFQRRSIAGSLIGGIAETQEMLDFCGEHGIVADIERIPMQAINEAYERMLRSDVRYRFVIDMASLKP